MYFMETANGFPGVTIPQYSMYFSKGGNGVIMLPENPRREEISMNEKAKKYVDLFRKVKIATAATADAIRRLHP